MISQSNLPEGRNYAQMAAGYLEGSPFKGEGD